MIKAILFDWGGVFTSNAQLGDFCKEYAEKKGIDFETFNSKMIELWDAARVGNIDSSLFWSELGNQVSVTPEQFHKDLEAFSGYKPEVLRFVKEALQGEYKLGIVSNQIETWFEPQIKKYNLKDVFDVISTSYRSRSAKPDLKIFKDTLVQLGVAGSECIYIDDMEKNIPPAQELEMKTILYSNLQQLKDNLRKYLK